VVWRFVVAALAAGWIAAMILGGSASFTAPTTMIAAIIAIARTSLLFGVLYLGAVILLHGGFGPVYQVGRLLQQMMPGSRAPKAPAVWLRPNSAQVIS
jgi:hypothetical protein